jgi:hypothetical protein
VHTLNGQSGDESGTYTRSILSGQDLYRIVATTESLTISARRPVENFLQGLSTAGLFHNVSRFNDVDEMKQSLP